MWILLILLLLLIFVYFLNNNINKSVASGFWSDRYDPDFVLRAGFASFLPPNKVINKGYNSQYWDCFELSQSLGTPNNEILSRCKKFI